MIDAIIPLPTRAELLGGSVDGLTDCADLFTNNPVRTATSRKVAVLPSITFYKIISHWGNTKCEHIVASDKRVNVFNLTNNLDKVIPIAVKMAYTLEYGGLESNTCYLFSNGINYLLCKYPKESELDSIIPIKLITSPIDTVEVTPMSVWIMKMSHVFLGGNWNDTVIDLTDYFNLNMPVNLSDPYWNLVENNTGSALSIASCISDNAFGRDDIYTGLTAFTTDICEPNQTTIDQFLQIEFHRVKYCDPLTKLFLQCRWFVRWNDLQPYTSYLDQTKRAWYNLAMSNANSTINFKGTFLPFTVGGNDDWEIYQMLTMINAASCSDFAIEVYGGCRPVIVSSDLYDPAPYDRLQGYGDIVGNYLCSLFIDITGHNGFIKGHHVTLTKTFLDEVFIVVEGSFGTYCYYLFLPYYYLTSPVLMNVR